MQKQLQLFRALTYARILSQSYGLLLFPFLANQS